VYVYGAPFYPDGRWDNTMRLNFSNAMPETIIEGVRRLAKVIKANL
jgi:2-aminoadipate transaminase